MNYAKIKAYIVHYVYGLLASSWNAGMTAVAAFAGAATAAAAGAPVEALNLHQLAAVFLGTVGLHLILYFQKNPIPEDLDQLIKTEVTTTSQVKVTETTEIPAAKTSTTIPNEIIKPITPSVPTA